jgi:hypothetical protein
MRMLLRAVLPNEPANTMVRNGTLQSTMQKILADLKPEAAYFVATDSGERCGIIIFDMTESSELPNVAEPFFLAFNAQVTLRPVMTPQDLMAAGPGFERAIKEFGKS